MGGNNITEIQRLRGIAVLLVLTVHILYFQALLPQFLWLNGRVGVDLFFVISGYVVTLSLLRHDVTHLADVFQFYRRRFFRLAPTGVIWALVHLALATIATAYFPIGNYLPTPAAAWSALLRILRLTYNYELATASGGLTHYWSLMVEWHFYLALPLILLLFRGRWRLPVISALVAAFAVSCDFLPTPDGYFKTQTRVVEIGLGVLLALLSRPQAAPTRAPLALRAIVGPALVLVLWCSPTLFHGNIADGGPQIIVYGLLGALIVWLAALRRDLIFGVPVIAPFLEWIGGISYSLYVCHFTLWAATQAILATEAITINPLVGLPLQLTLTFGIATMLNRLIERPGTQLGARHLGIDSKFAFRAQAIEIRD